MKKYVLGYLLNKGGAAGAQNFIKEDYDRSVFLQNLKTF